MSIDFSKGIADAVKASKGDRVKNLQSIFKMYVAKRLEVLMSNSKVKDALEAAMLVTTRDEIITLFRNAPLEATQRSVEIYQKWFDSCIEEILNDAAHNHEGEDIMDFSNQVLDINVDSYINEGGLYVPKGLAKR